MKIRTGFVSNSSSASFICEVCEDSYADCIGDILSRWPEVDKNTILTCLNDAEMVQCKNGHVFCEFHIEHEIIANLCDDDFADWDEEWRYYFPEKHCPLCSFSTVPPDVLIKYLLYKVKMSQADVEDEIREKFGNLAEFTEQMKELSL